MIKEINFDQDDILRQLTSVEKELDLLLEQTLDGSQSHELLDFYNRPLTGATPGGDQELMYERRLTRQQIFQKAFMVESLTDEITKELIETQRAIDLTQKHNAQQTSSALKITTEEGRQIVIDDILNTQYETLQHIES